MGAKHSWGWLARWAVFVDGGSCCVRAAGANGRRACLPWGANAVQAPSWEEWQQQLGQACRQVEGGQLPLRSWRRLYEVGFQGAPAAASAARRRALARLGFGALRQVDARLAALAALGCGLEENTCHACLDLGASGTRLFGFALGQPLLWVNSLWGGNTLERALAEHVASQHRVHMSSAEARRLKEQLGSLHPLGQAQAGSAVGLELQRHVEKSVPLEDNEVRDVLTDACEPLLLSIRQGLEALPVELLADLTQRGVHLVGGGARLAGMARFLGERTGLRFHTPAEPEWALLQGALALQGSPAGGGPGGGKGG